MTSAATESDWLTAGSSVMIAGPCSAESREQVLDAALGVSSVDGVRLFRAGLWKPRTRRGGFEGVGARGFPWLLEASERFGLAPCIEVGLPSHVESAVEHGLETVWVGARTSGDPFAVGQLAAALEGTRLRVLVKNPLAPSLALWLGALERIEGACIVPPAAVHRGFDLGGRTRLRAAPIWELPLELRRRRPDLSLICDPSHIAGRREFVYALAESALDLGMDGLMVEVHPNPAGALSDADQQMTPTDFAELCARLRARPRQAHDARVDAELARLRDELSEVDAGIISALARRWRIVRSIADVKRQCGARVLQLDRKRVAVDEWKRWCRESGLPVDLGTVVYFAIHEACVIEQTALLRSDPTPASTAVVPSCLQRLSASSREGSAVEEPA